MYYDDFNNLVKVVPPTGDSLNYAYDKRGNLVSVANGTDVIKSFVFDAANKMTESVGYKKILIYLFILLHILTPFGLIIYRNRCIKK